MRVNNAVCALVAQAVRGMLDNPNEPISDLSYFDCIESVMENSKVGLHIKQQSG